MKVNQQLTIFNWTDELLLFRSGRLPGSPERVLEPRSSIEVKSARTFALSAATEKLLLCDSDDEDEVDDEPQGTGTAGSAVFDVKLKKSATWLAAEVGKDCPWRIYRRRLSKRRQNVLVFPNRDLASFLSEMPDSLALSAVCLPGTHDTMAFYGWPMSQCQSGDTPLSVQLVSGIRVLDIRLAVKKGHLISYHGQYPQRTPFSSILRDLQEFLTSPKSSRETVVVSVKQEDYDDTPPRDFSATVRKEIEESPGGMGLWYLKNKVPLLGEVRGKAVMFSRFGGDGAEWEGGLEGLGIHPTTWPDSDKEGFSWELKNTLIRTQDWYHIPSFLSIPEKVDLATTMLVPPAAAESDIPVLSITYFSASSFPLAAPTVVSTGFGWPSIGLGVDGVNTLVGRWLLDMFSGHEDAGARGVEKRDVTDGPKLRGWTFMDFFTEPVGSEVVPLLVECNFRGRSDEEGWLQR